MSLRYLLPTLVASVLFAVSAPLGAAESATQGQQKTSAAYPKGQYAALDELPDWGGIWTYQRPPPDAPRSRPVLKGQYLKDYEAWRKLVRETDGMVPRQGSYCIPPGMPGIMSVGQYPIEFLFTPGRVTIHHEAWMQWRVIYTDGRPHPEDLDPSFQGHSIGRWEGDTLVVETVGIKKTVALQQGMGHSEQLRILERMHLDKNDPDTLVVEMTIEDPEALERPWTQVLTYRRTREADLIEFICAENDRNPVDEAGHVGFE